MSKEPFPSDMDLVGFRLGALEPDDAKAVAAALAHDPALRERLDAIDPHLDVLGRWPATPAPQDLADRTVARVVGERRPALHAPSDAPTASRRFRGIDVLVAACVVVMATLLLIPAVHQARHAQRVESCSQRLSLLGQALLSYADHHQGHFPCVGHGSPGDGAGLFGVLLLEAGYLHDPAALTCPGVARAGPRAGVPSMPEIRRAMADPVRLRPLLRRASGDYGYALGFVVGRRYVSPRRVFGQTCVVVSDSPYRGCEAVGWSEAATRVEANSANHGGRGQNVLFADGHVRWITIRRIGKDDIFLNQQGQVRAGTTPTDNVIGFGSDQP